MNAIETMLELLGQKQRYFEEYEELTLRMMECPVEEMEDILDGRQRLIGTIDRLSGELGALADRLGEPDAGLAKAAMRLTCERSRLPQALLPIFDLSQRICAVANRVSRCEPQLADRIEEELAALTERIKENNRSVSAKAARYQSGFGEALPGLYGRQIGKA